MSKIFNDNAETIGGTPMVKINRLGPEGSTIYAKLENRNPAMSVKCRIGAAMVDQAEKDGSLKPGMTIVEPTSGNTGIALAFVAAAKGYSCILTMPNSFSLERRMLMKALGAEIRLTDATQGIAAAIGAAEEIIASDPDKYWGPHQFENPANPAIHEQTTGPEIWGDTEGGIDILVSGVGTGGTLTGTSRYIKNTRGKAITTVAVEPDTTTMITASLAGEEPTHAPHKIQGIGAGFVPANLDLDMVDAVEQVTSDEAMAMAHRLMQEEGILAGISSGAAMVVADRLAQRPENADKTIVAILPDSGERYLTSPLFEGKFSDNETVQATIT
ncbi:cysteine synthase A [Halioglobus japonicus]|uniref:Cysteine synthase n=1 Tax=Halioglobus japonicus TaxID=930805 RepID=A0AAP8SP16_9GAMM|nr:cysteine synthase A [Halioglobus japonicus]AQA19852.1 cysteine synthase A [Halioglobus japonicus]PLW87074.1 cysteine synthase A [Halioglobus japonicus]GHD10346.1 cysteine synthase [Halioglobus japonicus]